MAESADYSKFKFSIKSNGQSIIKEGMTLAYITIDESVNSIPMITLGFSTPRQPELIKFDDLDITIEDPSSYQLQYTMGVYQVAIEGPQVIITGYACKKQDFTEIGSAYLGDSLKDAVESLGIRDKLNDCDQIEGGYWQINETKVECLARLMKGAKANSVWNMTNDAINVIDMTDSSKKSEDFIAPTEVMRMAYSKRFTGDEYYHVYESDEDNNTMFNVTWNAQSYIGYEHLDFAKNMISSMKYNYPMERLYRFKYSNNFLTYTPGQFMKLELEAFSTDSMCILSKTTKFGFDKVEVWIDLGTAIES